MKKTWIYNDIQMKKYKITQIRSVIDRPEKQKRTMRALGLRKINRRVVVNVTPQIEGMIEKVKHLVAVEEIKKTGKKTKNI